MITFGRTSGKLLAAAAVMALAGGCTAIKAHKGYIIDQALVESVQPGIDNKLSVERALGRPSFVSEFGDPAWYYVSTDTRQSAFGRPRAYKQTILRVRFDAAGNVAAVDKRGLEHVVRLEPDSRKTPTLGRNRSFLEDLFGNIGSVGTPGMGGAAQPSGPGPNGS